MARQQVLKTECDNIKDPKKRAACEMKAKQVKKQSKFWGKGGTLEKKQKGRRLKERMSKRSPVAGKQRYQT